MKKIGKEEEELAGVRRIMMMMMPMIDHQPKQPAAQWEWEWLAGEATVRGR